MPQSDEGTSIYLSKRHVLLIFVTRAKLHHIPLTCSCPVKKRNQTKGLNTFVLSLIRNWSTITPCNPEITTIVQNGEISRPRKLCNQWWDQAVISKMPCPKNKQHKPTKILHMPGRTRDVLVGCQSWDGRTEPPHWRNVQFPSPFQLAGH